MANSDYRNDAREVIKETNWTIWKIIPTLLLVAVVITVLGWGLKSVGIIGKDIDREVVQHSRQYTESKQASLQNLYTQYVGLQTKVAEAEAIGSTKVAEAVMAQQMAIIAQMRRKAGNIPSSELPSNIQQLIR